MAAIEVVLNSSCVIEKKPTVSRRSCHRGDHRGDRKLPLEAEPQIGENCEDRHDNAERAGLHEFAGDARADDLRAAHVVIIDDRRADLADGNFLRRVATGLHAEAQRHVRRIAETLHLDIADAEPLRHAA